MTLQEYMAADVVPIPGGFRYLNPGGMPMLADAEQSLCTHAEQGDAWAQYELGMMYYEGTGVSKDYAKALYWFRKAVGYGHIGAHHALGQMYANGEGVEANHDEAMYCWFGKTLHPPGTWRLTIVGETYYFGKGTPKNDAKALRCFHKTAEYGHAKAQYYLGKMYRDGEGVSQDNVQAYKWFVLSAMKGNSDVSDELASLEKLMTSEEIAEAHKLADEFILSFKTE